MEALIEVVLELLADLVELGVELLDSGLDDVEVVAVPADQQLALPDVLLGLLLLQLELGVVQLPKVHVEVDETLQKLPPARVELLQEAQDLEADRELAHLGVLEVLLEGLEQFFWVLPLLQHRDEQVEQRHLAQLHLLGLLRQNLELTAYRFPALALVPPPVPERHVQRLRVDVVPLGHHVVPVEELLHDQLHALDQSNQRRLVHPAFLRLNCEP